MTVEVNVKYVCTKEEFEGYFGKLAEDAKAYADRGDEKVKITRKKAVKEEEVEATEPEKAPEEPKPKKSTPKAEKPAPEAPVSSEREVAADMVRAILFDLRQMGKKAEVKELFEEFGVSKLSEIREEQYAAVFDAATAIKNAG